MKNAQKKTVVAEFFNSATKNAIEGYSRIFRQARMSGAAFRAKEEGVERHKIRRTYDEDLMMPFQSKYEDVETGIPFQIPAAILGATEVNSLTKVARTKLKLATNQMKVAELFFDFSFSEVDEKCQKLRKLINMMTPTHTIQFCNFLILFPQEMQEAFVEKYGPETGMEKHENWIAFVKSAMKEAEKQILI